MTRTKKSSAQCFTQLLASQFNNTFKMALTDYDKQFIRKRRKKLQSDHYKETDPERKADLFLRIKMLRSWLHTETPKQEQAKVMTKAQFLELVRETTGIDTSNPKATIRLDTKRDVDSLWPGIATANITIEAPVEVREYLRNRIRKEKSGI